MNKHARKNVGVFYIDSSSDRNLIFFYPTVKERRSLLDPRLFGVVFCCGFFELLKPTTPIFCNSGSLLTQDHPPINRHLPKGVFFSTKASTPWRLPSLIETFGTRRPWRFWSDKRNWGVKSWRKKSKDELLVQPLKAVGRLVIKIDSMGF